MFEVCGWGRGMGGRSSQSLKSPDDCLPSSGILV